MEESLSKANSARIHILKEMNKSLSKSRTITKSNAQKAATIEADKNIND